MKWLWDRFREWVGSWHRTGGRRWREYRTLDLGATMEVYEEEQISTATGRVRWVGSSTGLPGVSLRFKYPDLGIVYPEIDHGRWAGGYQPPWEGETE